MTTLRRQVAPKPALVADPAQPLRPPRATIETPQVISNHRAAPAFLTTSGDEPAGRPEDANDGSLVHVYPARVNTPVRVTTYRAAPGSPENRKVTFIPVVSTLK